MKVLLVRSDIRLAGPGRLMIAIAGALREAGADVVFATGGGELTAELDDLGIRHLPVPDLRVDARSIVATARATVALTRIIRAERPDAIHTFNAHAAACAALGAKLTRRRLVNTVLGTGKERWLRRVPAEMIAVSESVRSVLRDHGVADDRIHVVPNGNLTDGFIIDDDAFDALVESRDHSAASGPVTLCSIAMFSGRKGQDQIIEFLRDLVDAGRTDVRVVFVGDGRARGRSEELARSLGVADRCEFVGSTSDVRPYLDAAHVFVHFAELETFGMVLAEAGARGLPVVTHAVGGIPEVVVDGQTGIVVRPGDRTAAVDAICTMIDAPDLRREYGHNGLVRARTRYRSSETARRLLEIYTHRTEPAPT